jgi:hypothetical protein
LELHGTIGVTRDGEAMPFDVSRPIKRNAIEHATTADSAANQDGP